MCGIFGIMLAERSSVSLPVIQHTVDKLFRLSEKRGREAAGLASADDENIMIFKRPQQARKMISSQEYLNFFDHCIKSDDGQAPLSFLGHSRLVTNGGRGLATSSDQLYGWCA